MNKFCKFYDPYRGSLITMVGQKYIVDLLEKLEGKVDLIQSNTDGIIAAPLPGVTEKELVEIINEWQERTGFVLKLEKVYNIHQRDVNTYMFVEETGKIHVVGESVRYYDSWQNVLLKNSYSSKEPIITHHAIVDFFINNKTPEQTVHEFQNVLRLFQYICKKGSYEWVEYEEENLLTGEICVSKIQNVNRAFAHKSDEISGMIYKRNSLGKLTKSKVSNLPDNVFIYNENILEDNTVNKLKEKIDYQYYIDRSYERIAEFLLIPYVKDLKI